MCVCVCVEISRARRGSTLFKRDKKRERFEGGVIAKYGSNSEKRSGNGGEEGSEGTRERYR